MVFERLFSLMMEGQPFVCEVREVVERECGLSLLVLYWLVSLACSTTSRGYRKQRTRHR